MKDVTQRQGEILELMCNGLHINEIADRLGISRHTVRNHLTLLYGRLGVAGRAEAMAYWMRETPEALTALESAHTDLSRALGIVEAARDRARRDYTR